jgi:hypothetical protein
MALEALKELDEKFEEREKQNIENLETLIKETAQVFEVKVGDVAFKCYEPPASMINELQKNEVNVVELAAKYFPIIFGIPKEEVYKIPISTLTLLFKKYVETYTNMIKSQSFLDRMGKR